MAKVISAVVPINTSWSARAATLIRGAWSAVGRYAAKHPVIAVALGVWASLPDEVQDYVLQQIFNAVGETFIDVDSLVTWLKQNPEAQTVVLDILNRQAPAYGKVANQPPELLRRLPSKLPGILDKRDKMKGRSLTPDFKPHKDAVASRQDIDVIGDIQRTFGIRGSFNTQQLHDTLVKFAGMSTDEVATALYLRGE